MVINCTVIIVGDFIYLGIVETLFSSTPMQKLYSHSCCADDVKSSRFVFCFSHMHNNISACNATEALILIMLTGERVREKIDNERSELNCCRCLTSTM